MHDKTSTTAFDHNQKSKIQRRMAVYPKITTSLSACKKSAHYINSFPQYSRFYSLMN